MRQYATFLCTKNKKNFSQPQWLKEFCGMELFGGCQTSDNIILGLLFKNEANVYCFG